jgi:phage terminase small subunit
VQDQPRRAQASVEHSYIPTYLEGHGVELWDELAPLLDQMGVLTQTDRHSLGMLCDAFSRWRADPMNMKIREEFRRMLGEFGLPPASRTRPRATIEPVDHLDRLIASKRGLGGR